MSSLSMILGTKIDHMGMGEKTGTGERGNGGTVERRDRGTGERGKVKEENEQFFERSLAFTNDAR